MRTHLAAAGLALALSIAGPAHAEDTLKIARQLVDKAAAEKKVAKR